MKENAYKSCIFDERTNAGFMDQSRGYRMPGDFRLWASFWTGWLAQIASISCANLADAIQDGITCGKIRKGFPCRRNG